MAARRYLLEVDDLVDVAFRWGVLSDLLGKIPPTSFFPNCSN